MYLRAVHTDLHLPTLYAFIKANALGILTTSIPSPNYHTIQSSHIPWVLDLPTTVPDSASSTPPSDSNDTNNPLQPLGTLRGHLARANPQTKALIEALSNSTSPPNVLEHEVYILFNSPTHHYITPKFYVSTKPDTGKVVPTWNYAAVQIYGTARIYHDTKNPATDAFLSKQIGDLTRESEEGVFGYDEKEGREKGWEVGDAPEKYTGLLKKAIVGVEIEIKSVEGKFKMSQEAKEGDREGVVEGFERLGSQVAEEMARTVRERGMKA